jgi:hypothetical protein
MKDLLRCTPSPLPCSAVAATRRRRGKAGKGVHIYKKKSNPIPECTPLLISYRHDFTPLLISYRHDFTPFLISPKGERITPVPSGEGNSLSQPIHLHPPRVATYIIVFIQPAPSTQQPEPSFQLFITLSILLIISIMALPL